MNSFRRLVLHQEVGPARESKNSQSKSDFMNRDGFESIHTVPGLRIKEFVSLP
jgi:hypothetical protein